MSRMPAPLPALAAASVSLALLVSSTLRADTPQPKAEAQAQPAELRGAAAMLELANTPFEPGEQASPNAATNQVQRAYLDYINDLNDLDPQEAGKRWASHLALLINTPDAISLDGLYAFMPGPDAWPAIAEHLQATPEPRRPLPRFRRHLFIALSHGLLGESDAADQHLAEARKIASNFRAPFLMDGENPILAGLDELSSTPQNTATPDAYQQLLAQVRSVSRDDYTDEFELRDLIPRFGEQRATALLTAAFKKPLLVRAAGDLESRRLAQRLAVEMAKADTLHVPQFLLIDGFSTIATYEALTGESFSTQAAEPNADAAEAQADANADAPVDNQQAARSLLSTLGSAFGLSSEPDFTPYHDDYESWAVSSARREARAYYLTALLAANQPDPARRMLLSLTDGPDDFGSDTPIDIDLLFKRAKATDTLPALLDTFDAALRERINRPVLGLFINLALLAGETDRAVSVFESASFQKTLDDLPAAARAQALTEQASIWLALGESDHAITMLRQVIRDSAKAGGDARSLAATAARQLTRVAFSLNNPELLREAAQLAAKHHDFDDDEWHTREVAQFLAEAGLIAEAEAFLGQALRLAVQEAANPDPNHYFDSDDLPSALAAMAMFYASQDRHADLLTLLNQAPGWGIGDLAELDFWCSTDPGDLRLAAVAALAKTGQPERAQQLLTRIMPEHLGNDDAYALLLDIMGDDAEPVLDQLIAMDRFEERPVIWKARLLLNQGDADTALRLAEKAVAIDPSDGEQGQGDRMRAYAVIADAYAARNQTDKAEFFQDVVAAIRQSEQADLLYAAGLIAPALDLYAASLDRFSDAYCIQARIALRLADQGRLEEAEEHYRRSYELMPSSFGRIESHCFGCEGAFSGDTAQSIAEEVFEDMLQDDQTNPQLHYLLGYLRETQGREEDALDAYRKAVALDPDYFNAWQKLAHLELTPADLRNQAALRMLELDPLQRHHTAGGFATNNLAQLWAILERAQALQPTDAGPLLPLPAAAAHLQANPTDTNTHGRRFGDDVFLSLPTYDTTLAKRILRNTYGIETPTTLGLHLADTPFLSNTSELLDYTQYLDY